MSKKKKKKSDIRQDIIGISNPDYIIYTDGGCLYNPGGPGGIGVLIMNEKTKDVQERYRGYKATTNNRMELFAVIEGLSAVQKGSSVRLYSDSQYVMYCMAGMWKKKKNLDLWEKLDNIVESLWGGFDRAVKKEKLGLTWVKGHNGNSYNERCDTLATYGINQPDKVDDAGYEEQKEEGREFYRQVETHIKENGGSVMETEIVIPKELSDHTPNVEDVEGYIAKYEVKESCARAVCNFYASDEHGFKDYMSLKSGGLDKYSRETAEAIAERMSADKELYMQTLRSCFDDKKDVNAAARWNARGLSLEDSIRKVLVDKEINENIRKNGLL